MALATESGKRAFIIEDGNVIVPPTRPYKDAEIRRLLATRGIDGVLGVSVTGDTECKNDMPARSSAAITLARRQAVQWSQET